MSITKFRIQTAAESLVTLSNRLLVETMQDNVHELTDAIINEALHIQKLNGTLEDISGSDSAGNSADSGTP